MTKYEFYKKMADECQMRRWNTGDELLRKFFARAEKGFMLKAEKLSIKDAEKEWQK